MDLERAIQSPTDYSAGFVERVAELRESVTSRIGVPLVHDPDMNYSAAQKLTLWLDETGEVASGHDVAAYQLDFLISSKVDVYTVVGLTKDDLGRWSRISVSQDKSILADYTRRIGRCFEELGYTSLQESELGSVVDGHVTELNGSPATLFQVLFSEMY